MDRFREAEAIASNVRGGSNPAFTVADFLQVYPQFHSVSHVVVQMYIDMANENILASRWFSKWKVGMCLYVAHFLTLWAKTSSVPGMTNAQLAGSGESKGAVMSKSVDGVSVSYGQSAAESDLQGWGSFKETLYGQQFATLAKHVGFGSMYVL